MRDNEISSRRRNTNTRRNRSERERRPMGPFCEALRRSHDFECWSWLLPLQSEGATRSISAPLTCSLDCLAANLRSANIVFSSAIAHRAHNGESLLTTVAPFRHGCATTLSSFNMWYRTDFVLQGFRIAGQRSSINDLDSFTFHRRWNEYYPCYSPPAHYEHLWRE